MTKKASYTSQQSLNFLTKAFRNLFNDEAPNLGRFLRLIIDVLDPDPGYGPAKCEGDGTLLPKGCGFTGLFKTYVHDNRPMGAICPECGAVFLWSICQISRRAKQAIILTRDRTSKIGGCRSESDSGNIVTDAEENR